MMDSISLALMPLLMALASPTITDQATTDESPEAVRTEELSVEVFPKSVEKLLTCKLEQAEEFSIDAMQIVTFSSVKDSDCSAELESARTEFVQSMKRDDPNIPPVVLDGVFDYYLSAIENFTFPVSIGFMDLTERSSNSLITSSRFTVPDGMWQYHLCRSNQASTTVYMNGTLAEPMFPDDEDCAESRAYSRKEAIKILKRRGEPKSSAEREALVETCIEQIDARYEHEKHENDHP